MRPSMLSVSTFLDVYVPRRLQHLEEIAQIVGAEVGTVKSRPHRARERLRQVLATYREVDHRHRSAQRGMAVDVPKEMLCRGGRNNWAQRTARTEEPRNPIANEKEKVESRRTRNMDLIRFFGPRVSDAHSAIGAAPRFDQAASGIGIT
jgi:hypothetical protein